LIPALLALVAAQAMAMSYVPMADAPLLDQADTVVVADVDGAAAAPGHELEATRYTLKVAEVLKGSPAGEHVGVLVPGAADATRAGALSIPGAPRMGVGERVVAFLDRRADGDYVLVHLSIGAFHVRNTVSGTAVLVRDLDAGDAVGGSLYEAAADFSRQRELAGFSSWVKRKAAGQTPAADYWNGEALAPVQQARYVIGNPPARWFAFDNGGSVPFYASATGQLGLAGGGYAQFQQAIAAWDNSGVARINYVYAGLTTASGDLNHPDGVNKILFNDPTGFIGGIFDCINGGVAGYGGWRGGAAQSYNGTTMQPITEGDVVIRSGAGCLLSGNYGANATELFGHELGHTLGLGHPCGDSGEAACVAGSAQDQALMRPVLHADGRGATLGTDDLQGIAVLYPLNAVTSTGSSQGSTTDTSGSGTSGTGSSGGGGGGSFAPWLAALLALAWLIRHARRATALRGAPGRS
jgi:MprA protease rhombosortase-interaction domain-containing protein